MSDSKENNDIRSSPYGELKYVNYSSQTGGVKNNNSGPVDTSQQTSSGKKVLKFVKTFPLVIAGIGLTVYALGNGIRHFIHGNDKQQGRMMKLRVGAQGMALVCLMAQVFMYKPEQWREIFIQDSPKYFKFDDDDDDD